MKELKNDTNLECVWCGEPTKELLTSRFCPACEADPPHPDAEDTNPIQLELEIEEPKIYCQHNIYRNSCDLCKTESWQEINDYFNNLVKELENNSNSSWQDHKDLPGETTDDWIEKSKDFRWSYSLANKSEEEK